MVEFLLVCTSSQFRPTFPHISLVYIFPASTPMEPVIVPGWATILSAFMATKYPPEAATSPMLTMIGFFRSRARATSRQMVSDAT
jgi:hypothetical protein